MPTASFPGASSPSNSASQGADASQSGDQDAQAGDSAGVQQASGGGQESAGQGAGTDSRFPGEQQGGDAGGRDSSTGDLQNGQSGMQSSRNGALRRPGGDYGLDSLPSGASGGSSQQVSTGAGAATTAERAAILDERLRRGYETFDGFILGERERAQNESNEAGSVAIGGDGGSAGGAAGGGQQPQTMEEAASSASAGAVAAIGRPSSSSGEPAETFPPPEDIPSGRDDDVVARQLREAAMREPDPELREALWEEYRNYTGIGEEQ